MKYITLKDAKELMEEASDKYQFVTEIAGDSGRWSQACEVVFFDPKEGSVDYDIWGSGTYRLYPTSGRGATKVWVLEFTDDPFSKFKQVTEGL